MFGHHHCLDNLLTRKRTNVNLCFSKRCKQTLEKFFNGHIFSRIRAVFACKHETRTQVFCNIHICFHSLNEFYIQFIKKKQLLICQFNFQLSY